MKGVQQPTRSVTIMPGTATAPKVVDTGYINNTFAGTYQDYYKRQTSGYSKAPEYPDTSISRYWREHHTLFGYNAWKDKLVAEYNTAYNLYQQHYDSAASQVARLAAAGLNTNLAYGMASPGGSAGAPYTQTSGTNPAEVAGIGANILASLVGNLKTLGEAATIVAALPESVFKGKLSRQLDVAAAASGINAGNSWKAALDGARVSLGLGKSIAQQEKSKAAYEGAQAQADADLLSYMTSHDSEGSSSDFESSMFTQSAQAGKASQILDYQKNKKEWDLLLSNKEYYDAVLNKMVNEAWITKGQAWQVRHILDDPTMDDNSKYLALTNMGLLTGPARLAYSMTSAIMKAWQDFKQNLSNLNPFKNN